MSDAFIKSDDDSTEVHRLIAVPRRHGMKRYVDVAVFRQNSTAFDANSMLYSSTRRASGQLRTPVIPSDIRPPPAPASFRSASRRMQKQLQGSVTWKCVALVLVCFTAFLLALLSYLIGKYYLLRPHAKLVADFSAAAV